MSASSRRRRLDKLVTIVIYSHALGIAFVYTNSTAVLVGQNARLPESDAGNAAGPASCRVHRPAGTASCRQRSGKAHNSSGSSASILESAAHEEHARHVSRRAVEGHPRPPRPGRDPQPWSCQCIFAVPSPRHCKPFRSSCYREKTGHLRHPLYHAYATLTWARCVAFRDISRYPGWRFHGHAVSNFVTFCPQSA
jgi:hypothetical protein